MSIGKIKDTESGFTLVEVLVAMVIFSLVMALSVTSYRFSLLNLTKKDKIVQLEQLTTIKLINKQIRSLAPFYVRQTTLEQVPFFQGTSNGFLFITDTPILIDSPLAIASMYIEDEQLKYCEINYGSVSLESVIKRPITCNKALVYINSEEIELSYFGWKDSFELDNYYSEYLNVSVKPYPAWSANFIAQERKLLPLFIKIAVDGKTNMLIKLPEITPFQQGAANAFQG